MFQPATIRLPRDDGRPPALLPQAPFSNCAFKAPTSPNLTWIKTRVGGMEKMFW